MTRDTLFDMASLTKPVATATSVMILLERGKLRLNDRLGKLLPEFDNHGKGRITVEELLRHRAGLIADNALADYGDGPEAAWKKLADLELKSPPGSSYVYSDVGFLTLGRIVERVSGQGLDRFARENIFQPLGMADTGFLPADAGRAAPTEPDDGTMLRGTVHDPRARALGGVAGHAGLFGTADDLAVYAQTLLDGGLAPNGHRLLGPRTVRAMTDPGTTPAGQKRGLGWDIDTPHSAPRGALFGPGGYGHTGFTGTSLWVDPEILDLRHRPDQPPAPRRQGPGADRAPLRGRHDRRLGGAPRRDRPRDLLRSRSEAKLPARPRRSGTSSAGSTSWPATASRPSRTSESAW